LTRSCSSCSATDLQHRGEKGHHWQDPGPPEALPDHQELPASCWHDKKRLAWLPEIEAYYAVLLDQAKGVVRGELVTAVELRDARQEA
jgi:hypothetical protein